LALNWTHKIAVSTANVASSHPSIEVASEVKKLYKVRHLKNTFIDIRIDNWELKNIAIAVNEFSFPHPRKVFEWTASYISFLWFERMFCPEIKELRHFRIIFSMTLLIEFGSVIQR
jgi:hypothetical protein